MRSLAIAAIVAVCLWPTAAHAQRPTIRTLTEQEMIDMMQGSSIQASRSSNTSNLVSRVKEAFAQGRQFTMISLADLPDSWTVANLVGVGGGGAWQHVIERTKAQNLPITPNLPARAVEALSKHVGKKIDALIRFEPAGQTLNTFLAASELGIPVVDACFSGRAVPELSMQTSFASGLRTGPGAVVTRWGDVVILNSVVDDYRIEDLARAVAVASGGGASMAYNPMSGQQLKKVVIPGDVSTSILYGRALREARDRGADPIAALLGASRGFKLFQGVVSKADMRGEGGFTWWDVEIKGTGRYAGHAYKVFVKNENLLGWLDGVPDVMSPDLICNLDPKTGDTIVGPSLGGYNVDQEVVLVAIPAHQLWRTPRGVELLGPRHFGFPLDYVPVETLQQRRKNLGAH
ncbi:MAG: DUF917 domain-containing protein [Acidobacteria bacterium]|nr:DUF917 domain-containing protein [Acidobacteriota bacterium]